MADKTKPYGYIKHMMLFEAACFDPQLQNATRIVLGLIIRHTQQDGISKHFSIYKTAKKYNIKRQAIQNQVKKLKAAGYIKIIPPEIRGHRNKYKLLFEHIEEEPATQLDCAPATSRGCLPATPEGCPKKIEDNKEIKKEKNARVREEFLDLVKEAIEDDKFQDLGELSNKIILLQATACWETWSGNNEFPEGNSIDKFKGWIRTGIRNGAIKETSNMRQDRNARQGVREENFENPLQDWHKRIEILVGEKEFISWFRGCWHDGNGKLCAPKAFIVQRIKEKYQEQVTQIMPNVEIIHKPYKEISNENDL